MSALRTSIGVAFVVATTAIAGDGQRIDAGVHYPPPMVMGAIPKETVLQIVRSHVDEIRKCAGPDGRRGRIAVKLVVGASGAITENKTAEATGVAVRVEECVLRVMSKLIFPASSGNTIVTYSFEFPDVPAL